ncbi:fumarylacetoacetase [Actinomadura parmotrematis]|uniref:fumarylacetoacetase n=1 Tax=Actinomadura parmotrematis TaxID=2864039 RepID=A0ABS7G011_9ACTN|nr:fumarylacetoacetase [Actinomadura parmotrematis]MBW8485846.1 fumarylacetoacetase [Actinomadura parmotrematis]
MVWLDEEQAGFGIEHLPYGVFSKAPDAPRVGVRIAGRVLDLAPVLDDEVFAAGELNGFMSRGPAFWRTTRDRVTELLDDPRRADAVAPHLHRIEDVRLHLPFQVADYVDFYCSLEHASNLGRIFRPDEEPLKPNWRHLPVGYHGRAGTVVVSGTPVRRPRGLLGRPGGPVFGPSERLDIEAEVGFVVGTPSRLGEPVPGAAFADHVFGAVLVNDWSARDIQAFEYVPLGPFLGKSFATSVAAWVTPLAALDAARVAGPRQDPPPSPHLARGEAAGLNLMLEVALNGEAVSRPPFAGMYWTPDQMLAHMTANGAALRTGDLFASGTVSGAAAAERGSLIELTWNGAEPLKLADGGRRAFLEDGDEVVLSATAPGPDGATIALAPVAGRIEPAPTSR